MAFDGEPLTPPLTPCTTYKTVQRIISRSRLTVDYTEDLPGHLHRISILHLSNGSELILKISPSPSLILLRSEHTYLDTEAATLECLASSRLPIPQLLKYDNRSPHLGLPFILATHLSGIRYADASPYLTRTERAGIEHQLRTCRSTISQYTSPTFGPAGLVKAGDGFKTWREAFVAMLESVLMDGEDLNVNIPYFQVREAVSRWESYLDDVTEAKLVVPGLGEPENTLIRRESNEVTGMFDFGRAFWGDNGMTEKKAKGDIKGLLYTCYHTLLTIVRNHYRSEGDVGELDARKELTAGLRQLTTERI